MLRIAKGEDSRSFFSMQTPLLGFVLMNIGMLRAAARPDAPAVRLAHLHHVPGHLADGLGLVGAAHRLRRAADLCPDPAARRLAVAGPRVPELQQLSEAIIGHPGRISALGWTNIVLGVGLGIYTGILLNTMVARPLWNSAILGPLFLFSGLSAGAAMMHIASVVLPGDRPAPQGMIGGAFSAMIQPLGPKPPEREHRRCADPRRPVLPGGRADPHRPAAHQPADVIGLAHRGRGADHDRLVCLAFLGRDRRRRGAAADRAARPGALAPDTRTPSCRRCWCWSAATRCAG